LEIHGSLSNESNEKRRIPGDPKIGVGRGKREGLLASGTFEQ